MKLLEMPVTVAEKVQHLLQPIVADVRWLDGSRLTETDRQAWQHVMDLRLKEWHDTPDHFADEGREPPASEILPLVTDVAAALQEHGVEPPLRVLPNGEGGVVFEWRNAPYFWSLEVEKAGSLGLTVFRNSRLVSRHQLP